MSQEAMLGRARLARVAAEAVCQTAGVSSRLVVLGSCGAWPEPGRAC
jgi:hypothetical protein